MILDSTDKYQEIWFAIRSEIEIINGEKDCSRIKIDTDDDLSLNRSLKFQHWQ